MPDPRNCLWCEEPVLPTDETEMRYVLGGDRAVLHRECAARSAIGSVGHIERRCSCYGGDVDDPPGMSRREAAAAALKLFREAMTRRERLS